MTSRRDLEFRITGSDAGAAEAFRRLGETAKLAGEKVAEASDGMAAHLDKVSEDLAKLGEKVANPKIKLDDEEAKAKLDAFRLRFDDLATKVANPRLSVTGFLRAEADIARMNEQIDKLNHKQIDISVVVNKADKLSAGIPTMAALGIPALSLAAPLGAVGIGGLLGTSGMAVAGGSMLGAFGLLLRAPLKQAEQAYQQLQSAQIALTKAQQTPAAPGLNGIAAHNRAIAAAQAQISAIKANLSPSQAALLSAGQQFADAWNSMTSKFQMGAVGVVAKALQGLVPIVQELAPLFQASIPAVGGFVHTLEKGMSSPGFQKFVSWLASVGGPALQAFGQMAVNLGSGLASMFEAFGPLIGPVEQALVKFTGDFARWAAGLSSSQGFQQFLGYIRQEAPQVGALIGNLVTVIGRILVALAPMGAMVLKVANELVGFVNGLMKAHPQAARLALEVLAGGLAFGKMAGGIAKGVETLTGFAKGIGGFTKRMAGVIGDVAKFGGKIMEVTGKVMRFGADAATVAARWAAQFARMIASAAKWAAETLARLVVVLARNLAAAAASAAAWIAANALMLVGIGLVVAAVVVAVVEIVKHWKQIEQAAEAVWSAITSAVSTAFHAIMMAVGDAVGWVRQHWQLILAIITGPIGVATLFVKDHFSQIRDFVSSVVDDITGFFSNLPSRIMGAVSGLAEDFYSFGQNIVQSIINGISSMASSVTNAVGGILSQIPGVGSLMSVVPGLATGGLVTSPTLAVVGEAGPELVLPLSKIGKGVSSSVLGAGHISPLGAALGRYAVPASSAEGGITLAPVYHIGPVGAGGQQTAAMIRKTIDDSHRQLISALRQVNG